MLRNHEMVQGAWNPWRALRDRGDRTQLVFADIAPRRGVWQRDELGDLIVLDAGLNQRDRRAVLAHELIHAERGIGSPAASIAHMQREEELVRREVARRLVPLAELSALVAVGCEPVDAAVVGDAFDVPIDVAQLALELLAGNVGSDKRPMS